MCLVCLITVAWLLCHSVSSFDCNVNNIDGSLIDGKIYAFDYWNDSYNEYRSQMFNYETYPTLYSPSIIVLPESMNDLLTTVEFAKSCNYSIVIRSGGHQYSGTSSCQHSTEEGNINKCIQINLGESSHFSNLSYYTNKDLPNDLNTVEYEYILKSGPGISLLKLYGYLALHSLFLPGGICVNVHVGGHAQSSGHGYMERGFGMILDYVIEFTIVLANGDGIQHIYKPNTLKYMEKYNNGELYKYNNDIFFAVLGGSPGSFGIVTEYIFWLNKDSDYENTFAWSCIWQYNNVVLKELFGGIDDFFNKQRNDSNEMYDFGHAIMFGQYDEFGGQLWAKKETFKEKWRNLKSSVKKLFGLSNDESSKIDGLYDELDRDNHTNSSQVDASWIAYEGTYHDLYHRKVSLFDNPIKWIIDNATEKTGVKPQLCFPLPFGMSKMLLLMSKKAYDTSQNRVTQFASEYPKFDSFYNSFVDYIDVYFRDRKFREHHAIQYGSQMYFSGINPNITKQNDFIYGNLNVEHKKAFLSTILFYDKYTNKNSEIFVKEWQYDTWQNKLLNKSENNELRFGNGQNIRDIAFTPTDIVNIFDSWYKYYDTKSEFYKLINVKTLVDPQNIFENVFSMPIKQDTYKLKKWNLNFENNSLLCCENYGNMIGQECRCRTTCETFELTLNDGSKDSNNNDICKNMNEMSSFASLAKVNGDDLCPDNGMCCCGNFCKYGQKPNWDYCGSLSKRDNIADIDDYDGVSTNSNNSDYYNLQNQRSKQEL